MLLTDCPQPKNPATVSAMLIVPPNLATETLALVAQAGTTLMTFWPGGEFGRSGKKLKITQKPDTSFVTEADFASNDILVPGLKRLFPGDGVLSEEGPATAVAGTSGRLWIIDPLDGTQSFIDGNDDFSILLALTQLQCPVYSIMHFPARNVVATAQAQAGAFVDGNRLKVSSHQKFASKSVYLRHAQLSNVDFVYDQWMDSGLAFLQLCRGELDGIIIRLRRHREWDLAAPALMIQESGGRVSDEHGNPVKFYEGSLTHKYFVASNGILHDQLLALIPKLVTHH